MKSLLAITMMMLMLVGCDFISAAKDRVSKNYAAMQERERKERIYNNMTSGQKLLFFDGEGVISKREFREHITTASVQIVAEAYGINEDEVVDMIIGTVKVLRSHGHADKAIPFLNAILDCEALQEGFLELTYTYVEMRRSGMTYAVVREKLPSLVEQRNLEY
jgi:hypothetical protein